MVRLLPVARLKRNIPILPSGQIQHPPDVNALHVKIQLHRAKIAPRKSELIHGAKRTEKKSYLRDARRAARVVSVWREELLRRTNPQASARGERLTGRHLPELGLTCCRGTAAARGGVRMSIVPEVMMSIVPGVLLDQSLVPGFALQGPGSPVYVCVFEASYRA